MKTFTPGADARLNTQRRAGSSMADCILVRTVAPSLAALNDLLTTRDLQDQRDKLGQDTPPPQSPRFR